MTQKELIKHCHNFMNILHRHCAFCPHEKECDAFQRAHKFPPRMYFGKDEEIEYAEDN